MRKVFKIFIIATVISIAFTTKLRAQDWYTGNRVVETPVESSIVQYIDSIESIFAFLEQAKAIERQIHRHNMMDGFESTWVLKGCWNNQATPSQMLAGNDGMAYDEKSWGYWQSSSLRDIKVDDHRQWGVGFGIDWMRVMRHGKKDNKQMNQLYVDVRWKKALLSLGMKHNREVLTEDHLGLLGASISTYDYIPLHMFDNWLSVNASACYGFVTGDAWDRVFYDLPHEGFRNKQGATSSLNLKLGKGVLVYGTEHITANITTGFHVGFSARNDWNPEYLWRSQINVKGNQWGVMIGHDEHFGNESLMWLHRMQSWYANIDLKPIKHIDVEIDYSLHPRHIIGSLAEAKIKHSAALNLTYNIPTKFLRHLSISGAYAYDNISNGQDRHGMAFMVNWQFPLISF